MRDFIGKRKLWKHKGLLNRAWHGTYATPEDDRVEATAEEATLVGSEIGIPGVHMPVLDIDFPAALVPSSTPDHYHLYLNREMSWEDYAALLEALYKAGIVEEGFYRMSLGRRQSFVRYPGVRKQEGEEGSG